MHKCMVGYAQLLEGMPTNYAREKKMHWRAAVQRTSGISAILCYGSVGRPVRIHKLTNRRHWLEERRGSLFAVAVAKLTVARGRAERVRVVVGGEHNMLVPKAAVLHLLV